MKAAQIEIGKVYAVKVSGTVQPVKIISACEDRYNPIKNRYAPGGWMGRNQKTGREIRIRSAAKCRYEISAKPASVGLVIPVAGEGYRIPQNPAPVEASGAITP